MRVEATPETFSVLDIPQAISSFHNNNNVNKTFSQILENNLLSTFGSNELLLMLRNLLSFIRLFINLKANSNVENNVASKTDARQRL
jgi:hypothetical protein